MDGKNNGSFWPSYVDIMTTLFAIMLVLFTVSFSRFMIKEKQLQALVDEYENIITVYSAVGSIDSTAFFGYNKQYLKHLFTVDVVYQTGEYKVDMLKLDKENKVAAQLKRDSIVVAGKIIKKTILDIENKRSKSENQSSDKEQKEFNTDNIKFLVVIEGQASKDGYFIDDWRNNYTLSYLRAHFLNEFWKENGIDLGSLPKCELIISGSGEGGVPRVVPNEEILRKHSKDQNEYQSWHKSIEEKNQRFLIHIVPVIGNIDVTKEKIDAIKR